MTGPAWISVGALCVLAMMMVGAISWLVRSELKDRRQARAVAALARRYRKSQLAETSHRHGRGLSDDIEPIERINVSDLIARNLAEGRAVRLNWEEDEPGPADMSDWPTGVLPRVPRDDDEW